MVEDSPIDLACSVAIGCVLAGALGAFVVASLAWGRPSHERLAKEIGLPLLGKVPLEAVYAALVPIGRGLARLGVSANAVTVASLVFAGGAGALLASGHFGVGAALAVVATLADAIDGFIARETKTAGRFGQVLDTTIDRYVDAFLIGGIAIYVRTETWLLVLAIGAIVGGFMVSYASSVLRELGAEDRGAPMRRAHRVAYLLTAAALVPFAARLHPGVTLAPVALALAAIAIIGNVSAVTRLLRAARAAEAREEPEASPGIESIVPRERHP